ncbi:PREDICTED: lipopolysaccharide-induced tumor necrosis factor-alpha factor homolog [Branchiostoma belcheri]|uniref:Lipopolysaccharide-induced tumor necrosis factor-alpha factor homolog n=1 Tax=Branchiostoma belcheri TaxID=7741 RepID=A0A6P5A0S2_BRABE|nr:PREDICTED: lipopolysaccharide-induced tumor necrosis factor-alpha factor homolog [Branchiostoma belcheri]XP_019635432.1 PREDICTED: lipopolysaccharide-induced tumor necrosis factor-alpha factor homolog [Branchiostoma belcheri]
MDTKQDAPPAYPAQQPPPVQQGQPGAYPAQQPGTYPAQQPGAYPAPQPAQPPPPGQPGVYAPQPQQPGYAQQPPGTFVSQGPGQPPVPPGTAMYVSQPGVVVMGVDQPTRSQHPFRMTCPTCQQNIQTTVEYEIGLFTWLMVGGVCLFGFAIPFVWLGCCFIPLCIKDLKDAKHTCPNCSTHLGTYKRAK